MGTPLQKTRLDRLRESPNISFIDIGKENLFADVEEGHDTRYLSIHFATFGRATGKRATLVRPTMQPASWNERKIFRHCSNPWKNYLRINSLNEVWLMTIFTSKSRSQRTWLFQIAWE